MTKKTRIRVARIAAGAVIAAGASLTAAGAASAVGVDINVGPLDASVNADRNGVDAGLGIQSGNEPCEIDPTLCPTDPTTGGSTGGDPTTGGSTGGDPTTGGSTGGDPTTGGSTGGDPT
ncbi:hypothetical protein ABZY19_30030, partial [Streptomyces sp. NPDC006475]